MKKRRSKKQILKDCIDEADYIFNNDATIRDASIYFGRSKSIIHRDIHIYYRKLKPRKYKELLKILNNHFELKYINGGIATAMKYKGMKK